MFAQSRLCFYKVATVPLKKGVIPLFDFLKVKTHKNKRRNLGELNHFRHTAQHNLLELGEKGFKQLLPYLGAVDVRLTTAFDIK